MSEIQEFYKGQNVFITGGTGFIGKILMEKLLRGCPDIGNIYLLMRVKKGKSIHDRLNELTTLPIFEPLGKINPGFQKKLIPISGDATKPGLGLSDEDHALLIKEVSIVFHAAACTKFDDPLRLTVPINVNSVMELIHICRECQKLKAAVYVSTAFSQCVHENIEERVYPMVMSYEEINNTVQMMKRRNFSEEEEVQFTKILMGKFPNTYVFTKSIAEGVLNEKARDLPFSIYRFPIALATYKEPVPGWVDTVQGFNQALVLIGIGVIRVFNIDENANLHIVPADFACNGLIAIAWETDALTIESHIKHGELPVYNYVCGKNNPLTWYDFHRIGLKHGPQHIPMKAIYYPHAFQIKSPKIYAFYNFFLHLIPALLGDVLLRMVGRKPMLHKIYKKGNILMEVTRFFTLWNWSFESERVQSLWNKLSRDDKDLFPFDLTSIDWEDAIIECWKGTLKYALKDNASSEERFRKYTRLHIIHRTIQVLFATLILRLIWKFYSCG